MKPGIISRGKKPPERNIIGKLMVTFPDVGVRDCIVDLDGSGLPGAVWAQQGEKLAPPDVERYVIDRQQIPIALRRVLDLDCVFSFSRHRSKESPPIASSMLPGEAPRPEDAGLAGLS